MKKEIVILGAGKIARGYIADLFHDAGYKIVFLCHSLRQASALRNQGQYKLFIKYPGEETPREKIIDNYDAYSTVDERQQCAEVLSHATLASLQVYPAAFQDLSHLIAEAVKLRMARNSEDPLDVIICVNYIDPQILIDSYIREVLTDEEQRYYEEHVSLVLGLTYRSCSNPLPYMLEADPQCAAAIYSPYLPVDKDAFKGSFPEVSTLYPTNKLRARLAHKIWCMNVGGCVNAFLGYAEGVSDYYESLSHPDITRATMGGKAEGIYGFSKQFDATEEEMELKDCWVFPPDEKKNATKKSGKMYEPYTKVLADPIRKLSRTDRIIGPALACVKAGKTPFYLAKAAAAGFMFDYEGDRGAVEIQDYLKEHGIREAVIKYCELNPEDKDDSLLLSLIVAHYNELKNIAPEEAAY